MSYLKNENNEIIVDAILTKLGREKLSRQGALAITKFSLSDDEVDYELYNVSHPLGAEYFDVAIRELPVLEALPGNNEALKYLLYSKQEVNITTVSTLQVSYPAVFTSGIQILNAPYSFSPQIIPALTPSQQSKVYYVVEMNDIVAGQFKLEASKTIGTISDNDVLNATATYARLETQYKKYAVGSGVFSLTAVARPSSDRVYPITVTAVGPVTVVPYKFNVKVLGTKTVNEN